MSLRFLEPIFDENAQPDPLGSEADHRIANNLMLIAGLVRLRASHLQDKPNPSADDIRIVLKETGARIDCVSQLHRLLVNNSQGEIDLAEYLRYIVEMTVSSLSADQQCSLILDMHSPFNVPAKQAVGVGLAVQEVVANSLKYAHPTGVDGEIMVNLKESERPDAFVVEIADDGVGFPEGFDPKTSNTLGMRVLRSLATQLRAELEFDASGIGLCVQLVVPRVRPLLGGDSKLGTGTAACN